MSDATSALIAAVVVAALAALRAAIASKTRASKNGASTTTASKTRASKGTTAPGRPATRASRPRAAYPGDFTGSVAVSYTPKTNRQPDPGEIVWTWVPYEDDAAQGKDRPVLLVGRDGAWLLGLMLTSKDHNRDAADEARWGRHWMDIGAGAWDRHGRPSEIRLDRVVRVDPQEVRREGAILDAARFDAIISAARTANHW
jgi:hypothetical protein